ncbi:S41 family peptidase [Pedobacter panaciterrae]|uniref:S41 family peptidase n=1 Tax=Pedobacter panaciterrae TaxID=363849 RepID=A0ABU8NWD8_9SPHI|nr:S41 family peptidase [uncultured Pedobacter sp.]
MIRIKRSLFPILLLCSALTQAQSKFNGNFEVLDSTGNPEGWNLRIKTQSPYIVKLDSTIKLQGKYAISITDSAGADYGGINFKINKRFKGKQLMLVGNLKTQNVTGGFAGIWMRTDGINGKSVGYENSENQALTGTNDWKEFMIQLPYDGREIVAINVGAVLAGKGTVWVDSLRLYLDEKPIDEAREQQANIYQALKDTVLNQNSGIDAIPLTPSTQKNLSLLGEVWGFLKYHHPAVANGDYNWDAELFRVLPEVLSCRTDIQVSQVMEKWVDKLGKVPPCADCKTQPSLATIAVRPDYGSLFKNKIFSKTLSAKLDYILKNTNITTNYYVGGLINIRNSSFLHENKYADKKYPDAGLRLLALYRYWSMIQYFCPNRELTTEKWSTILPAFIPQVIKADNEHTYVKAMVKLIASIHDSHAFIESEVREQDLGRYRLPFDAGFVGDQLIVTSSLKETFDLTKNLTRGDIITAINGEEVQSLINKYLPITPASNHGTALRDMTSVYLRRGIDSTFNLQIIRNNVPMTVVQQGLEISKVNDVYLQSHKPAYQLINTGIGYVYCGAYKNTMLDSIKTKFKDTKGIIVDMRGYPVDEMERTFVAYFKPDSSIFAKFTGRSISNPGMFTYEESAKTGIKTTDYYKGKVVVLVNENSQSNSEFVTMALQSAPNTTVIGSSSAGADGNVTPISLPGAITTWYSGLGVYYPDGTNAQRVGVKINKVVRPTIDGILTGKDEVLEEAKKLILINK